MSAVQSKQKLFTYWRARFQTEPFSKSLHDLLASGFAKTTIKDRLRNVSDDYRQFINYMAERKGFFCASFLAYEAGSIAQVIAPRLDRAAIEPEALPAPKASDGARREFVDGKLYFACKGNRNHRTFIERYDRPAHHIPPQMQPIDLSTDEARRTVRNVARNAGAVHVLIGGPPCQGFSSANRNSWFSGNPNNRLVDVFLNYIEDLRPSVFVMENVQGILWTTKAGPSKSSPIVVDYLARRMRDAGYLVFAKPLDAVWYGVPQHRSRIFFIGIHKDVGYRSDHFGDWGPFPKPTHGPGCPSDYVTVREAIRDLPPVPNGADSSVRWYRSPSAAEFRRNQFLSLMRESAPQRSIFDHVTSRHAPYVIERYRRIPAGGNWEDIAEHLTNYAHVGRTHSNIYRRLEWDRPAITIGHYRKSMIVHPAQHRGLSLREASRLQSFPDWFNFSGPLVDQQQQLANAVCPLVAKSIAEFILRL